MRVEKELKKICENPASLVEIKLEKYEGGTIYGDELSPDIKEFVRWLFKQGVKKEVEEHTDGTIDFLFYVRTLGRRRTWRLKKVYRLKPNSRRK
jgi:hypothetical protein